MKLISLKIMCVTTVMLAFGTELLLPSLNLGPDQFDHTSYCGIELVTRQQEINVLESLFKSSGNKVTWTIFEFGERYTVQSPVGQQVSRITSSCQARMWLPPKFKGSVDLAHIIFPETFLKSTSIPLILLLPSLLNSEIVNDAFDMKRPSSYPLFLFFYNKNDFAIVFRIVVFSTSGKTKFMVVPGTHKSILKLRHWRHLSKNQGGNLLTVLASWGGYKRSNRSLCVDYFLYAKVCSFTDALAENLAWVFNFTTFYLPSDGNSEINATIVTQSVSSIVFGSVSIGSRRFFAPCNSNSTTEDNCVSTFVIRDSYGFVYCIRKDSGPGRSYITNLSVWLRPFSSWAWILFIFSTFAVWMVTQNKLSLFQLVGIILRHEMRKKDLLVILFSLTSFVLSSSYESVVTSLLIIPAPPQIYQDFPELLDAGYKILVPWDISDTFLTAYSELFTRVGLSHAQRNASLHFAPVGVGPDFDKLLPFGNVTTRARDGIPSILKSETQYNSVKCYMMSKNPLLVEAYISFLNHMKEEFARIFERFRESGISQMYFNWEQYLKVLSYGKPLEDNKYKNRLPVPLSIKEGKIAVVFQGLVGLLGVGTLWFVVEIRNYCHF